MTQPRMAKARIYRYTDFTDDDHRREQVILDFEENLRFLISENVAPNLPLLGPSHVTEPFVEGKVVLVDRVNRVSEQRTIALLRNGLAAGVVMLQRPDGYILILCDVEVLSAMAPGAHVRLPMSTKEDLL